MYLYEYRKEHGIVPDRLAVQQLFALRNGKKRNVIQQISDLLEVPLHNYSC
jgi:hypothetical protein